MEEVEDEAEVVSLSHELKLRVQHKPGTGCRSCDLTVLTSIVLEAVTRAGKHFGIKPDVAFDALAEAVVTFGKLYGTLVPLNPEAKA